MKFDDVCGASSTASSNSIVPFAVSMKTCGDNARRDELRIVVRRDRLAGHRADRRAIVAGGIELRAAARPRARRTAQSLSASAALSAGVASAAPYSASAVRMAARASMAASGLRERERLAQRLRAAGRLELADEPRRRGAHREVRLLELRRAPRPPASGALSRASAREDRRHDPAVLVLQHRAHALERGVGGQASRAPRPAPRARSTDCPDPCSRARAGSSPGRSPRPPAARRRASPATSSVRQILDDRQPVRRRAACRAPRPLRGGRCGRRRGSDASADQRRRPRGCRRSARARGRPRRPLRAASARTRRSATSGSTAARALVTPSPRAAKAAEYLPGARSSSRSAGCARGSSMRPSAYATGHHVVTGRPPGVEHGGGQRLVRAQPHERENPQPERLGLRSGRPRLVVGLHRRHRGGARVAPPPCGRSALARLPSRRSGRAPRRRGRGRAATASASAAMSAGAADGVADEPQRERRHLAHLGIGVRERRGQRLDPVGQSHAADRHRGAPAHARLRVGRRAPSGRASRRAAAAGAGRARRADRTAAARRRRRRPRVEGSADPRAGASRPSSVRS